MTNPTNLRRTSKSDELLLLFEASCLRIGIPAAVEARMETIARADEYILKIAERAWSSKLQQSVENERIQGCVQAAQKERSRRRRKG